MTYKEILSLVGSGDCLPPFQSLPDRMCYESLSKLKSEYELLGLDEKQVRVRKQDIRRAYEESAEAYKQYMGVYAEYNRNSQLCGSMVKQMMEGAKEQDPDYKSLFLMAVKCIGIMSNDSVTPEIIKKILEGHIKQ